MSFHLKYILLSTTFYGSSSTRTRLFMRKLMHKRKSTVYIYRERSYAYIELIIHRVKCWCNCKLNVSHTSKTKKSHYQTKGTQGEAQAKRKEPLLHSLRYCMHRLNCSWVEPQKEMECLKMKQAIENYWESLIPLG